MVESTQAVFLSYAPQDAEPARRICVTLRAAGLEVWFEQSELCGGERIGNSNHLPVRRLFA
jgi:hypothetical protein